MTRHTLAEIDLNALTSNLDLVKKRVGKTRIIAMVKSNAYGHGIANAARGLAAADAFGVACIDEALELRQLGVQQPIILMEGFFEASELPLIYENQFEIVIHHLSQLQTLEKARLFRPIKAWLKVDTGMHRLGFLPEEIPDVWPRLQKCTSIIKPVGFMTHFADADKPDKGTMNTQLQCFKELTQGLQGDCSLANSAAILINPQAYADWVRPGIMLYGVSPFADRVGPEFQLKPVMTLRSRLISVRRCYRGDAIGYGGRYTCPEDMLVGVVAIGYGDGYPRHAIDGTPVLVNKQIVPLVGRPSMDMITVNLQTVQNAKPGDPVVLWGNGLPIEYVARHADTIAYELLCGVTRRVRFVTLG